jgi:cytoskeletal protein RodZ
MQPSIGQRLKAARLRKRLTLEEISEATRIRLPYLEALEADDFSAMDSPVQRKGFLRIYAQYLGLDAEALLEDLRAEEETTPSLVKIQEEDSPPEEDSPETESSEDESGRPRIPLWQQILHRKESAETTESDVPPAREADSPPEEEAAEEESPPQEPTPADEIFREIGRELLERREILSLTHREIERHLHIPAHYLKALEEGNFSALPSSIQTRGMLHNYAEFLDLDVEALLLRFADALQARLETKEPPPKRRAPSETKRRISSFLMPDLILSVGLVLALIGFTIWGVGKIAAMRMEEANAAKPPSVSDVLLATNAALPQETPTPAPIINTPVENADTQVTIAPPPETTEGVQISISVVERTWMRVLVDDKVSFEGRALPGSAYTFDAETKIEILTGNAAALRVTYNQRDLGLLGNFGEVTDKLFGTTGILTPTVTPTPTPTATPKRSPTPTMTFTPTATATPTVENP